MRAKKTTRIRFSFDRQFHSLIAPNVNVADFFTKGLDKNLFIKFRGYLGMDNFASP